MHSPLSTWTAALALAAQSQFSLAGTNGVCGSAAPGWTPAYASPIALAVSANGQRVFVACATDNRIAVLDTSVGQITRNIPVPAAPLGLALRRTERGSMSPAAAQPAWSV